MGLLQNIAKKRAFKNNIATLNFLYEETRKSIQPCWNVFYHYNYLALRMHSCELSITETDIRTSVASFRAYIDQLVRNIKELSAAIKENPKLRKKYCEDLNQIKKFFPHLHSEIAQLIKAVRSLDYYPSCQDLLLIVKLLEPVLNKLWLASEKKNLECYENEKARI